MEVDFEISREELLEFQMNHIHETSVYKKLVRIYIIYLLVMALIIVVILRSPLYIGAGLSTCSVFFGFKKRIVKSKIKKKISQLYELDKFAYLFKKTHLSFTDDGIEVNTRFSEKIYKWDIIK